MGIATGGHATGDTLTSIENVAGSHFDDTLLGDAANNFIGGNQGDDFIEGRDGNDFLNGGAGSDVIVGGAGNDILVGGTGQFGDAADTFVFDDSRGLEEDWILDFDETEDIIDLSDTLFTGWNDFYNGGDRYMEQSGNDVVIHYYDHEIVLFGTDITDLSVDNFIF